jgi:hypothetical protein
MSWDGDYSFLYERFMANKDEVMKTFNKPGRWGDQDFIKETHTALRGPVDKFQHKFPDLIVSYKHDVQARGLPLKGTQRKRVRLGHEWWNKTRIVVFHGAPKPAAVDLPWVPKLCAA